MKLKINNQIIDLTNKTLIMGILNLSPDSPVKNSIVSPELAVQRAYDLRNDGATIIDVGAHSTSSKAKDIPFEKERTLVIPIVEKLISEGFIVSLDTWNPNIAREAVNVGLELINDVTGLQDSNMAKLVAEHNLTACIMHMRGKPKEHYKVDQNYENITKEIYDWFSSQIQNLGEAYSIQKSQLILDPGFEFGKSMVDNLQLLDELHQFLDFELPLLVSASKKAFIAEAIGLGRTQKGEGLLEATLAVQTLSAYLGANILRVHDVKEVSYAIKFVNKLKNRNLS